MVSRILLSLFCVCLIPLADAAGSSPGWMGHEAMPQFQCWLGGGYWNALMVLLCAPCLLASDMIGGKAFDWLRVPIAQFSIPKAAHSPDGQHTNANT